MDMGENEAVATSLMRGFPPFRWRLLLAHHKPVPGRRDEVLSPAVGSRQIGPQVVVDFGIKSAERGRIEYYWTIRALHAING